MAILIDENTRMLIQGITGRFGQGVARRMLEVGSKVVSGVTPGRGGQSVWGVPVYDSVNEAIQETEGVAQQMLCPKLAPSPN
ncbi:Succinate--CoA ligase [GDP-forming] subunit alpha [subsurface metagenome]